MLFATALAWIAVSSIFREKLMPKMEEAFGEYRGELENGQEKTAMMNYLFVAHESCGLLSYRDFEQYQIANQSFLAAGSFHVLDTC